MWILLDVYAATLVAFQKLLGDNLTVVKLAMLVVPNELKTCSIRRVQAPWCLILIWSTNRKS